jgi:hypothetical protein
MFRTQLLVKTCIRSISEQQNRKLKLLRRMKYNADHEELLTDKKIKDARTYKIFILKPFISMNIRLQILSLIDAETIGMFCKSSYKTSINIRSASTKTTE